MELRNKVEAIYAEGLRDIATVVSRLEAANSNADRILERFEKLAVTGDKMAEDAAGKAQAVSGMVPIVERGSKNAPPRKERGMSKVHLMLQKKDGVGKSFVCALLAGYKRARSEMPFCIDADADARTFSRYKALDIVRADVMTDGEIDSAKFDVLLDRVETTNGNDVLVDTGATAFASLIRHIGKDRVPHLLANMGCQLVIHTVIAGGPFLGDTIDGFAEVAAGLPEGALLVVWVNPHFGPVEQDGTGFERSETYNAYRGRISGMVKIPELSGRFQAALEDMIKLGLTFGEDLEASSFTQQTRRRLNMIKEELFASMVGAVDLDGRRSPEEKAEQPGEPVPVKDVMNIVREETERLIKDLDEDRRTALQEVPDKVLEAFEGLKEKVEGDAEVGFKKWLDELESLKEKVRKEAEAGLKKGMDELGAMIEKLKKEIEAGQKKWMDEGVALGNICLNESLKKCEELMLSAGKDSQKTVVPIVKQHIEELVEFGMRKNRTLAVINVLVSAAALITALCAFWLFYQR